MIRRRYKLIRNIHNFEKKKNLLKLNYQLSFQDDITSTESDLDESSNDENFLVPNQNHQPPQSQPPTIVPMHKSEESKQQHQQQQQQHVFIQAQNQKINAKMLDNQKLLLESLSNLPQNLLQSWIQSGQLQVSVDDGKIIFRPIPLNLSSITFVQMECNQLQSPSPSRKKTRPRKLSPRRYQSSS